jgi:hypothetical protein
MHFFNFLKKLLPPPHRYRDEFLKYLALSPWRWRRNNSGGSGSAAMDISDSYVIIFQTPAT